MAGAITSDEWLQNLAQVNERGKCIFFLDLLYICAPNKQEGAYFFFKEETCLFH